MSIESIIPAAITTVGSLIGGSATNKTNKSIAASNNATEIELANTAHQREVADLKAAGLNPILSASGSGSSTPSLTSPTVTNVMGEAMSKGITNFSALESARQSQSIIDKARSETKLNEASAVLAGANAASALAQARNTNAETVREGYGKLGWLAGTHAADAVDTVGRKLKDVITDVYTNSAKKVTPSGAHKNLFDIMKGAYDAL